MATRSHLQSALDQSVRKTEPPKPASERTPSPPARSREHTKMVSGHFALEVSRQLKMIAAEEDSTVQALLREALNDLFIKRGKAPIA